MADVFSKHKRSQIMAAIRSRGNKDTELKLASILRAARITGWRRNQPLSGHPDFVFRSQRVAIFVDGCFWHGCRWHLRMTHDNPDVMETQNRWRCCKRQPYQSQTLRARLAGSSGVGAFAKSVGEGCSADYFRVDVLLGISV